jgi:hypothetical protein
MNGQLLMILSRIATVTHATTTSVAQIEFAASQKRQAVTKLRENEMEESLRIRFCTALCEIPLKNRVTLIVVLLPERTALRSVH